MGLKQLDELNYSLSFSEGSFVLSDNREDEFVLAFEHTTPSTEFNQKNIEQVTANADRSGLFMELSI